MNKFVIRFTSCDSNREERSTMPWLAELRSRIRAEAIDKWGRNDAVDGALEMLFEIVTIELRSHGKFRLTGEPVEDQL